MRRLTFLLWLVGLLLMLGAVGPAAAQAPGESPVRWRARFVPTSAKPGATVAFEATATVAAPWHLYALDVPDGGPLPTEFTWTAGPLEPVGKPTEPEPHRVMDDAFGIVVGYHEGSVTFRQSVRIPDRTPVGATGFAGSVRFMVCSDRICLPPVTVPLDASLTVLAGAAPVAATPPVSPSPTPTAPAPTPAAIVAQPETSVAAAPAPVPTESVRETTEPVAVSSNDETGLGDGWWQFLGLAFSAGLLALLTPCVFPMVPLTVSFFSRESGGSRAKAVRSALWFGFAVIAAFTGLGAVLSLLLGASGASRVATHPAVNLAIGLVFIAFALSLLGLFELRLPSGLLNYLDRRSRAGGSGAVGLGFMGLTLACVSFSCTAPFVGGLLAATATGSWLRPIVGMAAFSTAFALPFVALALFPHALGRLPRSGTWLGTVKVLLGFIELGAAFKFLSNADLVWGWGLISRPLVLAIWIPLAVAAGFYLLGKLRLAHDPPVESIGPGRLLGAIGLFAVALSLTPGLFGADLGLWDAYLPPRSVADPSLLSAAVQPGTAADSGWRSDYEAALAEARSTGRPVFIDFTGYTCTNCRRMETSVFPLVADQLDRFVRVRLYTDDGTTGPRWQKLQYELTGTVALPTYAVLRPDGQLIAKHSGLASVAEFTRLLNSGL